MDVRQWLPGDTIEKIKLVVPADLPKGEYKLFCELGGGEYPNVQFAMQTEREGWLYRLAELTVL